MPAALPAAVLDAIRVSLGAALEPATLLPASAPLRHRRRRLLTRGVAVASFSVVGAPHAVMRVRGALVAYPHCHRHTCKAWKRILRKKKKNETNATKRRKARRAKEAGRALANTLGLHTGFSSNAVRKIGFVGIAFARFG